MNLRISPTTVPTLPVENVLRDRAVNVALITLVLLRDLPRDRNVRLLYLLTLLRFALLLHPPTRMEQTLLLFWVLALPLLSSLLLLC